MSLALALSLYKYITSCTTCMSSLACPSSPYIYISCVSLSLSIYIYIYIYIYITLCTTFMSSLACPSSSSPSSPPLWRSRFASSMCWNRIASRRGVKPKRSWKRKPSYRKRKLVYISMCWNRMTSRRGVKPKRSWKGNRVTSSG